MNHAVDLILREDFTQQCFVPHVADVGAQGLAGELPHPLQGLGAAVAQIIHGHHFIAAFQQLKAGVGADVAHAARNQYCHNA